MLTKEDMLAMKSRSEQTILQSDGKICDWLPIIEAKSPRSLQQLIGRALVMNMLINIHFQSPIPLVRQWIETQGLTDHLSPVEQTLLQKSNEELTKQESIDLYWYIEALWALMWAGNLIPDLPFTEPVADIMASLVPDLSTNENGDKFVKQMQMRSHHELLQMLDLYYRVHWYTVDGSVNKYSTGEADGDIVVERRKALEWLLDDQSDWDDMVLNT